MLPEALLRDSVQGELVVPQFLGAHDQPWLRALLDEHERFVGRPQRLLDERLREALPCASPPGKRALAIHVLGRVWRSKRQSVIAPARARAAVFGAAAEAADSRVAVLSRIAAQLAVGAGELEESLFADLPGERLVTAPDEPVAPLEVALRANLALAQALLYRASFVTIEIEGNARAVVRHAKLRGLICAVAPRGEGGDAVLEISGPFALFRHTLVYGRALGELLPLLAWCQRFRLRATCILQDRRVVLGLASGDPIFPAAEPRVYDSRLEERFARDFRRAAPDWDVIREPEPVRAGGTLVFPDFALQHRADSRRRWLLEIVGFWTADYVTRKLAHYRAAGLTNLILCIDEDRDCADGDLPAGARLVRFRRRIDIDVVRKLVEQG